jgi:heme/copper-type cytochrome/quinol oxidase subunit 3
VQFLLVDMIGHTMNMNSDKAKAGGTQNSWVSIVYLAFLFLAVLVYHWMAEGEYSGVMTLSAVFQCMAMCLLGVHALSTGSIHGISAKSLQLEAIALVCRLSSTTWLQGYLPADASGDHLYQAFDFVSLGLLLALLYHMKVHRESYEADDDNLSTVAFVVVSFVLACILHADLDERPFWDAVWMCGLFLASAAPLPQLWLMAKSKTKVPALMSHFVAAMALGRFLSGMYFWEVGHDITCEPLIGDFNHAMYTILGSHVVHVVLLADFAYFYIKNLATSGLTSPMELPETYFV